MKNSFTFICIVLSLLKLTFQQNNSSNLSNSQTSLAVTLNSTNTPATCNNSLSMNMPSNTTYPVSDPNACPVIPSNYTCGTVNMPNSTSDCSQFNIKGVVYCCLYTGVALGQQVGVCIINTAMQVGYFNGSKSFSWTINGVYMQASCISSMNSLKLILFSLILILLF